MKIEFNNVSFSYTPALPEIQNLSFTINKGEFTALIGANGAGKTTLVKLCAGLLKPASGEVLLDGVSTAKQKTSALAGRLGFLFQNPDRQICCSTALEEILFTPLKIGSATEELRAEALSLLQKFGISADVSPFNLSRGQRQILALLSVMITKPEVLIIDEPTTGLDYNECTLLMEEIQSLNQQGATVLAVCHDMELVVDYARRAIVLQGGTILADGVPAKVFRQKEILSRAGVLPPQIIQLAEECGLPETVCSVEDAVRYLKEKEAAK